MQVFRNGGELLTENDGLIDPETAEDPVDIASVPESVSRHHDLE